LACGAADASFVVWRLHEASHITRLLKMVVNTARRYIMMFAFK